VVEDAMLVVLKVGGSVITDKSRPFSIRMGVIDRVSREIAAVLSERRDLKLVLVHGGGSFGHFVASEFLRERGAIDAEGAYVIASYMDELNRVFVGSLNAYGVPAVSISSRGLFYIDENGVITGYVKAISMLLNRGLVPVLYGDVGVAGEGLGIISGDAISWFLAGTLGADRLLFATTVDGVYDRDPSEPGARLLSVVRLSSLSSIGMGGAHGMDVTGGMKAKLGMGIPYVRRIGEVIVFNGRRRGYIYKVLRGESIRCTRVVP